ncbi:response regulator transcription factor [Acidobacteriota bacterium]
MKTKTDMLKILIIEDDEAIVQALKHDFEFEGFIVDTCCDGLDGFEKAFISNYELIILDILLPKMDGLEVCRRLKEKKIDTPIIMLTAARTEEMDKVIGLELGADDYITKPFGAKELMARVKAVLRRTQNKTENLNHLIFGNVEIDFNTHEVHKNRILVKLTPIEFKLLSYLIKNKNVTVSRDDILNEVWDESIVSPRTIEPHIVHLRQKLEENPALPKHILAIRGTGYIFKD